MTNKKMLIDATHSEETRVAIIQGDNRLDDFDFENIVRKTIKGNIFLVKVTRVEPSLQAAFVDFGGNRHGFLPFPEIHPDYYRIPIADREALIAEQEVENQAAVEEQEQEVEKAAKGGRKSKTEADGADVEFVGGDEDVDESPTFKRHNLKHRYKIQEVIKRNQIMLIQASKEERGNKGAAVSSYISLPGRYCVLMPNSPRAGGVSRKVNNTKDRQRMKKILSDLNVPDGMSVIIRTAGIARTKAEIKRDFEYLMRLWGKIRDLTLKSTAPQLVHEEGDLIMRAMRDLYRRDIDEVLVEGENGYKRARDFMKTLMPSHAKNIKQYKDDKNVPLFYRYHVEKQIDEVYSVNVQLPSGGYLVINPTEALISVDVNSGKATKGRHIEETALRTNIEAAEEVARQLRLRDLGGLVVIDFIDMEENKNNRTVERHLKDAMARDRARIQIGRISAFGLMELSRQRMRPSLVETNFELCDHCHGVGLVRTVETSATVALRALEEEGLRGRADKIKLRLSTDVALYLFNHKREMFAEIEAKYGMVVEMEAAVDIVKPDFTIEVLEKRSSPKALMDLTEPKFNKSPSSSSSSNNKPNTRHNSPEGDDDDNGDDGKRRRRRGRRGGRRRNNNRNKTEGENQSVDQSQSSDQTQNQDQSQSQNQVESKDNNASQKSTRGEQSTRGGVKSNSDQADNVKAPDTQKNESIADAKSETSVKDDKKAAPKKRTPKPKAATDAAKPAAKPKKPAAKKPVKKDAKTDGTPDVAKKAEVVNIDTSSKPAEVKSKPEAEEDKGPKRGGWWNKFKD